ncbi:PAS domain S-box-containing protein/diguanylate cyclase (GGDEF) domain-containing protein [Duganella sacchari]|uniref:PAS domain S-box-containing protein/diguanylate cyclase (GGDEF) domain-containing protein n=1 Tax=Duganella sacchari TaxID=551987 RepID=A0A1M7PV51_9BURK|nr:EAL domain-containing protein [Duganella sacchari]SHN21448.1 PAS domain S-box-containing protein/diguanylate cyclase (GGDEF) domain-containing protein [Duganella sacchari]
MYSRLFVPIFAIIAVVVGVRYHLMLASETGYANARYQKDAGELVAHLRKTLAPALATPDRGSLDTTLSTALLLNPDLSAARLDFAGGHLEALRSVPAVPDYPGWFTRFSTITPFNRTIHLGNATLALSFEPTLPLMQVWRTIYQQAIISVVNVTVIYTLLGLIIFANKRMLRRLADATNRFQSGDHDVRLPISGTLEARMLASTFNNMAQRVQALVHKLQQSQNDLSAQLTRTLLAQQQLQVEKDRIEVTLASIGDAVITTDLTGGIETINEVAQQLTGWSEARARGMQLHQVFILANNFGQHSLLKSMKAIYAGGEMVKVGNQSLRNRMGQTSTVEYTANAIRTPQGEVQGSVLVFRDVTERRQLMQQISWQSNHDILTGLPNRTALAQRFEQEVERAREHGHLLAVCLFDLDHFQHVNQSLGQAVGDEILKQAASRLHDFAGQRHYVARLGGDEFVLLLPELNDRAAIEYAMGKLMAALARDYICDGEAVSMSASVGIAVYTGNDISADSLLRHADQALYQAKITGRNRHHFFDADLDEQVRTHHNRRTEVRAAVRANELALYYQPKLDMRKGRIIGMEALLRWEHPLRGTISPGDFLPIVEHSDVIVDIGEWVLREALRQLESWRAFDADWVISVNIAARHFQRHDFVERLKGILAEFPDVPPHMLELEILESSALSDISHVRSIMLDCQALGISFALDDFGTGYSSMSYLKRLPADVLKIDQSFVRNMLVDRDDLHLVSAVIGLARSFGLGVIAEGVETIEHGAMLMRLGCDLVQGYGIARPMPADDVLAWVASFDTATVWQAAASLPPIMSLHDNSAAGGTSQMALI